MKNAAADAVFVPSSIEAPHALRADLRGILARVVADSGLSQTRTAKLCSTDQPTVSKILSGRTDSVSTDQLFRWLVQLGCEVEISIRNSPQGCTGSIRASFHE